jgi:SAM-dependent methyltransferase
MSLDFDIPQEFSYEIYRNSNKDLSTFSEERARQHYKMNGQKEGRICSSIKGRASFLRIIPKNISLLEIGPFFSPSFYKSEYNVNFLDVFSTEQLRRKANAIQGVDPAKVPDIDYVCTGQSYFELIRKKFDCVFSSHSIEHQPCLITHLCEVSSILEEGGRYFIVVPDKRYCFDSFFPESTIADVLEAYLLGRREHSIRTVMRGWLLTTHNDALRFWSGDKAGDTLSQPVTETYGRRVKDAVDRWRSRKDYIDAHAWQFTPANFSHLVQLIYAASLTSMEVEAVYPTLRNSFEFYAILRRSTK